MRAWRTRVERQLVAVLINCRLTSFSTFRRDVCRRRAISVVIVPDQRWRNSSASYIFWGPSAVSIRCSKDDAFAIAAAIEEVSGLASMTDGDGLIHFTTG